MCVLYYIVYHMVFILYYIISFILHYIILHYIVLYYIILYYTKLYYTATIPSPPPSLSVIGSCGPGLLCPGTKCGVWRVKRSFQKPL